MDTEKRLEHIAARRWRVALALTATMLVTYFGFLLLVAYEKAWLGTLVSIRGEPLAGLSWGILLGALVIIVAWALTGIYVRWANRHYDAALDELRSATRARDQES